jgi:hypothetical protein
LPFIITKVISYWRRATERKSKKAQILGKRPRKKRGRKAKNGNIMNSIYYTSSRGFSYSPYSDGYRFRDKKRENDRNINFNNSIIRNNETMNGV